jgi:septum formation topological specificity factor MinE
VFEELTPEVMELIKPDVLPVIQDYVSDHVNKTLHQLTMRDLFHVLLGEYELGDIAHLLIP